MNNIKGHIIEGLKSLEESSFFKPILLHSQTTFKLSCAHRSRWRRRCPTGDEQCPRQFRSNSVEHFSGPPRSSLSRDRQRTSAGGSPWGTGCRPPGCTLGILASFCL